MSGPAGPAAGSAPPHDHSTHSHAPGAADDDEHRAQDLVGVPLHEIEKTTADNAARIERQTGRRPGRAQLKASADADPGVSGQWSPVLATPVVPVFTAVLPNGRVLIWDSVGDNAAETYPTHNFTRAMVWNPADNTSRRVDLQGTNLFCAGFAHLANGNILVAGGNANAQLAGTVRTYVFNWQTETWTRGNDMAGARWYPSVTEMANGEEVIIGGGPATAEVYQTNGAIRPLPNFTKYNARIYPFMISRPDTQLGLFGPYNPGYTITTMGNAAITGTANRDTISREYGSFSTFDIGRTLVVGGGSITEDGVAKRPTRTAVILDSNKGLTPTVTTTGSMSVGRRQHNATILADGTVLVTGGLSSTAKNALVDLDNAVTTAELWNPATGQWTALSAADRVRQYHSTAALLPDGRIMTGGGGICAACMSAGYLEKNVEYFSPPYLFKKDGSGELADRPVISAAPATVGIGTAFTLTSPQAATIGKVGLVGLGDVTHSIDQGQRYVPLKYSVNGTTLTVTGPPTGGVAPPGWYMLFVTDNAGVPSIARLVQVAKAPAPLMSPLRNSTGKCVDIPSSALTARTYLQTYTCNNTKAQALTRFTDDTLRVFGMCADVPSSNFTNGQRIWQYGCNGTGAQRWQFRTDGTVRPVSNTALCLAATANTNAAQIKIVTCTGAALQKWTW
ncbi:galactose oxidase-like domain-containing protein [Actinoplanes philippinensis]|uniref:galactose oxidase-like domain-containing protein n=1 Tax=Actinoplanes philippinensis TaxID=35752 RepID=UPI001EF3B50F|nr:galactose oxidase-like domain-containing protein [Actinoplanes philippinensis]